MWQAFFFEISTKYIFLEKVFLKGISPANHSLQQHKTVLQLSKLVFSFVCLRINPTVTSKGTGIARIDYYYAQDLVRNRDKLLSSWLK